MKRYKVLIADDHSIVRDGLKQMLLDTDDLIPEDNARNGNEALALIRQKPFDLLVLDISMPGRTGLEIIHIIRDEKFTLPILVLSMHEDPYYATRAIQAGANGYIPKASDSNLLLQAMRRVASGGMYLGSLCTAMEIKAATEG